MTLRAVLALFRRRPCRPLGSRLLALHIIQTTFEVPR